METCNTNTNTKGGGGWGLLTIPYLWCRPNLPRTRVIIPTLLTGQKYDQMAANITPPPVTLQPKSYRLQTKRCGSINNKLTTKPCLHDVLEVKVAWPHEESSFHELSQGRRRNALYFFRKISLDHIYYIILNIHFCSSYSLFPHF